MLAGAVTIGIVLAAPVFFNLYLLVYVPGIPLIGPALFVLQLLLVFSWAQLAAYALAAPGRWLPCLAPGVTFLMTIPLLFLSVRISAATGLFLPGWWSAAMWLLFAVGLAPRWRSIRQGGTT